MGILTLDIVLAQRKVAGLPASDLIGRLPSFGYLEELFGVKFWQTSSYVAKPVPGFERVFSFVAAFIFALVSVAVIIDVWNNLRMIWTGSRADSPRLHRAPGFTLLRVAEFVYSKKVFEEIIQPTIIDFQGEYVEALAAGRNWKARWVLLRGYWSFIRATGTLTVVGSFQKVVKIIRLVG
jgi:hypothetical protein